MCSMSSYLFSLHLHAKESNEIKSIQANLCLSDTIESMLVA